jgi:hypothetical protein
LLQKLLDGSIEKIFAKSITKVNRLNPKKNGVSFGLNFSSVATKYIRDPSDTIAKNLNTKAFPTM